MKKSAELQQRTKAFALRVLKLIEHLPNSIGGRVLANQVARSATSVGANYRAACRARSRAEFASKLETVAEEADESLYWLELIRDGNFVPEKRIASLVSEGDELTAIFTSGRRSASRPQPSKIKPQTSSS
ncbi:MAG: four helix bundle protein [Chthoniobacterales bacterium]